MYITDAVRELMALKLLPIHWHTVNALAVDALRGSIKEFGFRGTLTEYFNHGDGLTSAISRAIYRLENLHTISDHYSVTPFDWKLGLGTYKWKYDTEIIIEALAEGIDFIDTAESYGFGRVEKALGSIMQLHIGIATKVARNHLSYQSVLNAANRSIAKLGHVNLYQVHWPNIKYPIKPTMQAMKELLDDEKIDCVGVSNYSVDQIITAHGCLAPRHSIASVQVRYNLMDRGIERYLLPWCQKRGIGVIAFSPLGQKFGGILGAKGGNVLRAIALRIGITEAQLCLAWIIAKGAIPIPRTNNLNHLMEIVDAKEIVLANEDVEELEAAFPILE